MSNLFGSTPKIIPEFTGLQVNTAVQVMPIPIIYGSPRVQINLIYYNGFYSAQVSSQSGKGILSGGKGSKQTEYFATIILAIGEAEITDILIIYQDQEVWTPLTFPNNGVVFFEGEPEQVQWSYINDTWPGDGRNYPYLAYYGFLNAELDSSATVPQINLVPKGIYYGTSPLNFSEITITSGQYDSKGDPLSFIGTIILGACDADPALCIYDYLTNWRYGAGFPAEFIDTSTLFTSANGYDPNTGDTALSTFCQAVGLAWSVVINNTEGAGSRLDRWCKNLNVAIVWNGAYLRFIPYWDSFSGTNPGYVSGSSTPMKYFCPYTTSVVTIPIDQILQSESKDEDPITFSRKDPWEVYNTVRMEFMDRTNFFNANPVEAKDESLVELYGPRVDNMGQADEFTLQTYANVAATMQLRRNASIRRNFTWKMGPLWAWLDPMDIVTIPDPCNYNNQILVRIISATDDEDENVTFVAEEFPVGSQSPTTIPMSPTTPPNQGPTNSPPSPVSNVFMFCPPPEMLTAQGYSTPQWIFGCTATYDNQLDTNWGGATIWVSLDNVSYQQIGTQTQPSTVGSLVSNLAGFNGTNPDNSDSLIVNLGASGGSLASVSESAAAAGNTLLCLQDVSGIELLSYTTATLTGPNTYALTGLYRGLYGTLPRFWGTGSAVMAVGEGANYFETTALANYIGKTFYVKAVSFNIFNSAPEDLSSVAATTFTLTNGTIPPPVPPPATTPPSAGRRLQPQRENAHLRNARRKH